MNVMVCYKRLQSGEESSQKIRAFISRTLKPLDTRPMQDRATGDSPADGATPSSPRAGPNSHGSGVAHDSHYPVTDAKRLADSSTFDSEPASANPVGAASGTHACNSSTGSTKSPSLEPAASNPESVVSPRVKAAAVKDTCCPPEATGSSVRQDPLQSGPERKAASSAVAAATAEEHVHLAMIALSALQWIPHQPHSLRRSIAASTPAIFQLLHDLLVHHLPNQDLDMTALFRMGTSIVLEIVAKPHLARAQLQDLLHLWIDRLARDITLQRDDVLLCEDGRLEEALARLMVPIGELCSLHQICLHMLQLNVDRRHASHMTLHP